jgi:hypothetical protein
MTRYIRLVLTALVGVVLVVGITSNALAQKSLKDQIMGTVDGYLRQKREQGWQPSSGIWPKPERHVYF